MAHLISGLSAAVTALVVGMLIAGAAESAHAADVARAQSTANAAALESAPDQGAVDAEAYRTQLGEALKQLEAAYAELAARDTAYRQLLASSEANVARLEADDAQVRQQLQQAIAQIQQLQARQTTQTTTTGVVRHRDDD